jgi:hypothetical protein
MTIGRQSSQRRFPPPWSVEEQAARFTVSGSAGQKLAYVYFEDEPGRRSAAKLLTRDEARRIVANVTMLSGALNGIMETALSIRSLGHQCRGIQWNP